MYSNPDDAKEYQRQYYLKNQEKMQAKARLQRENNPEAAIQYHRTFYKKHHEMLLQKRKVYRENNPDKIRAYRLNNRDKLNQIIKVWRQENKEICRELKKRWEAENPDKVKAAYHRYYKKHRLEHLRKTSARYYERNYGSYALVAKITNEIRKTTKEKQNDKT